MPELIGGSADLTGSNLTLWSGCKTLTNKEYDGNYIYYGVREFGMSTIMNGLALHSGFIPYGGTFLVFCDYARNAVRLAALMHQKVIFVYTHDSIGLGEDGPTHQPIEHISLLRMPPNMSIWRPCDSVETVVAWKAALERTQGPTSLLFSRQKLPYQSREEKDLVNIERGGYILLDCVGKPEGIIIATGSEVHLATEAAKILNKQGQHVRVVSMPSTDVFEQQDKQYQERVLPRHVTKRLAVEAAATAYWYKWVGLEGCVIGLDRFGESAPAGAVFKELGFTVERVTEVMQSLLTT